MRRRLLVALMLAGICVLVTAIPASATGGASGSQGTRINVTGGLVVAAGETVGGPAASIDGPATIAGRVNDDVLVGRGDLRITGHVTGDVLVLRGDATITGRVDGDITVVSGRAIVKAGADVRGDVTSGKHPQAVPGTVHGHVKTLDLTSIFTGFVVAILALLWLAVTVSSVILGLLFIVLFPRAADSAVTAGRRVGISVLSGLLVGILGPIVGVAVIASVVGIPLGLAVLATVTVLAPLGYVTSALILGRLMIRRAGTGARIGAFLAGFGVLRFAALVPGIGFVVWYAAVGYGIGALTVAAWRAGRPSLSPTTASSPDRVAPTTPDGRATTGAPAARPAHALRTPTRPSSAAAGTTARAKTTRPSAKSISTARPRKASAQKARRPVKAGSSKTTARKKAVVTKQPGRGAPTRAKTAVAAKKAGAKTTRPAARQRAAKASKRRTRRPAG